MTEKENITSSMNIPRYANIATFMRCPHQTLENGINADIGIIGVPWDGGTTNRPGPRHAPRQMRDMSSMIRHLHPIFKISPFDLAKIIDLGDAPCNPADINDTLAKLEAYYTQIHQSGITPVSAGGDHLVTLPILRALGKNQPLALIQFDAHTDLWDHYFGGYKYTHGTPIRRAIEENLLNPQKIVQIGIRGSLYGTEDQDYAKQKGVTLIPIEEACEKGAEKIIAQARDIIGTSPTYISFDIDCLDPAFAPGTGTPEIGGFTSLQAQQMVRELRGMNIIGADLVEVSPPFDPSGYTALIGVTIMFELMTIIAEKITEKKA